MNKPYTLILNKSYMPLGVECVKKTLGYFIGDEGKALDPTTYELFSFSEWIKRHNITDVDATMRSEKLWILIPEIIVLNTNSMKTKNYSNVVSKRKVFDRDGHRCGYCNCTLTGNHKTIDHVIPTSRGGKNTYDNVVACCSECNCKKGDKTLAELGWKLTHKLYIPDSNILYNVPVKRHLKSWDQFIDRAS